MVYTQLLDVILQSVSSRVQPRHTGDLEKEQREE